MYSDMMQISTWWVQNLQILCVCVCHADVVWTRLDQALRLTVDSFVDGQECNLDAVNTGSGGPLATSSLVSGGSMEYTILTFLMVSTCFDNIHCAITSVSAYIYIYTYIHTYMCIYIYIYIICVYAWVCMYTYISWARFVHNIYIYVCVCICLHMHTHMYLIYIYIYIYFNINIYIYTFIYIWCI